MEWIKELEAKLLELEQLTYTSSRHITEVITCTIENWAKEKKLQSRREVHREWMTTPEGRAGRVDLILTSPSGREVAVEIDRSNKQKSHYKLQRAKEQGLGALWVRWDKDAPAPTEEISLIYLPGLREKFPNSGSVRVGRRQAWSVECPTCGAIPGQLCKKDDGGKRLSSHESRHSAFVERREG